MLVGYKNTSQSTSIWDYTSTRRSKNKFQKSAKILGFVALNISQAKVRNTEQ